MQRQFDAQIEQFDAQIEQFGHLASPLVASIKPGVCTAQRSEHSRLLVFSQYFTCAVNIVSIPILQDPRVAGCKYPGMSDNPFY